jgi:isopentenyl diphosphate isomerase/L-lactate dehydrogenase-like FMN-dependent dehydrogenase
MENCGGHTASTRQCHSGGLIGGPLGLGSGRPTNRVPLFRNCVCSSVRTRFTMKNFLPAGCQELPKNVAGSGLAAYVAALFESALTWKDIQWLAGLTKLPVLVKGILRADDALRAVNHGASAIIVSNHGARQLDTTPAAISVLQEIVEAVAGAVEVYVDGGIRRGTDVLKALAYGARAVLVGRPILWGLAVGGEAGVKFVLEMLRQEFDLAMALSGCPSLTAITRDLVRP